MRNSLLGKLSIYCYIQCDIVSIVKKKYFCVYKKKYFCMWNFPLPFIEILIPIHVNIVRCLYQFICRLGKNNNNNHILLFYIFLNKKILKIT